MTTDKVVTLKILASKLGMSHSSVSRALSGSNKVSEKTRARVRKEALAMGYVANSAARLMRQGESSVVGLIMPDLNNEFWSSLAQGFADIAARSGRPLLLSMTADDPVRELAQVRALSEARPSGILAVLSNDPIPETLKLLERAHVVQFMRVNPQLKHGAVTTDSLASSRLAVDHLIALGHRRIAFVGMSDQTALGAMRLHGFLDCLEAKRIERDSSLISLNEASPVGGFRAAERLIEKEHPPSAIVVSSPAMTLGVARALAARGLTDPRKLSLVGSGSLGWFDLWPGGMTSTTLPIAEMVRIASDMLFRGRQPEGYEPTIVSVAPQLAVRGSTAPFAP